MFYRWRRMGEEHRCRVWRLYGWFSALMACGSCVGAVAWAARMMFFENAFKGNVGTNIAQRKSLIALAYSWRVPFLVTYAIEFLCLSAALLMVLDRMSVFAAPQGTRLQKQWAAVGCIVMAVVVLGNAVGLAANIAAAVHYQKAAEAASAESAYYAANNTDTDDSRRFYSLFLQELQLAGSIASVQSFCEVAVLLFIVVAFVAVGVLSVRRVSAKLLEVNADSAVAATGRALRLQMLGTTAFVFGAFVLRSVFSTMVAIAYQLRDTDKKCPVQVSFCDASCYNDFTLITMWMLYTPEFQLIIVLISSPLALLVALWGMTPRTTLNLMKLSERESMM